MLAYVHFSLGPLKRFDIFNTFLKTYDLHFVQQNDLIDPYWFRKYIYFPKTLLKITSFELNFHEIKM